MTWRPKQQSEVTSGEAAHAKLLLALTVWKLGVIEEAAGVQYRGAMHPNASGDGVHRGVEVWTDAPPLPRAPKPEPTPAATPRRKSDLGPLAFVILGALLLAEG